VTVAEHEVDAQTSDQDVKPDPREQTSERLLALLESADRGSSELDAQVAAAIGWRQMPDIAPCEPPPYSQSLDAALSLVPDGWSWNAGTDRDTERPRVGNYAQMFRDGTNDAEEAWHAGTPALAVCISALRARQAKP
jgi:hypothetical protein